VIPTDDSDRNDPVLDGDFINEVRLMLKESPIISSAVFDNMMTNHKIRQDVLRELTEAI